jgi:hypothetical protein
LKGSLERKRRSAMSVARPDALDTRRGRTCYAVARTTS